MVSQLDLARFEVRSICPRGKAGAMSADCFQHGRSVDGVESIRQVHRDEHFICSRQVSAHPLPDNVHNALSSPGRADSHVDWLKGLPGICCYLCKCSFAYKSPHRFTYRDGPEGAIWFRESYKLCPTHPRPRFERDSTSQGTVDQGRQLPYGIMPKGSGQNISQVL